MNQLMGKNTKKLNIVKAGAVFAAMALMMSGCGGNSAASDSSFNSYENSYSAGAQSAGASKNGISYTSDAAAESYYDGDYGYEMDYADNSMYTPTADSAGGGAGSSKGTSIQDQNPGAKLIRKVNITMDTEHFDDAALLVEDKTRQAGGYIQNSEISDYSGGRRAYIEVRVPYDQVDVFLSGIDEYGTIRSKNDSTQDITLQYADTEAHIENLETQHKRLLELLEKAENLEEIIILNEELTSVESELSSYKREIRNYDNLVSYSTISITINEQAYIAVEPEDDSLWGRMTSGLSDTMHNLQVLFSNLLVWFVVNLPIFLLLAVVIVLNVVVVKLIIKICDKKREKKRKLEQERQLKEHTDNMESEENAVPAEETADAETLADTDNIIQ